MDSELHCYYDMIMTCYQILLNNVEINYFILHCNFFGSIGVDWDHGHERKVSYDYGEKAH